MRLTHLNAYANDIQAISKKRFGFKIAAEIKFNPDVYYIISNS